MYGGSCDIVRKAFYFESGCCSSCHEDADWSGYYLCEIEVGAQWFSVCCEVLDRYSKAKRRRSDAENEMGG